MLCMEWQESYWITIQPLILRRYTDVSFCCDFWTVTNMCDLFSFMISSSLKLKRSAEWQSQVSMCISWISILTIWEGVISVYWLINAGCSQETYEKKSKNGKDSHYTDSLSEGRTLNLKINSYCTIFLILKSLAFLCIGYRVEGSGRYWILEFWSCQVKLTRWWLNSRFKFNDPNVFDGLIRLHIYLSIWPWMTSNINWWG